MSFKYMLKLLKGEQLFKISMSLMFISVLFYTSQPYLLSLVIKSATAENANITDFLMKFGVYGLVSIITIVIVLTDIIVSTKIVSRLSRKSNEYLFEKLSEKSISFIFNNTSGNIGSKVEQVSTVLKRYYITFFQGIVLEILMIFLLICYICFTLPIVGLIVILNSTIYIYIAIKLGKKVKLRQKNFSNSQNNLAGFIVDSVANILLMKSFSSVENEKNVLNPLNQDNYQKSRKFGQIKAFYGFATRIFTLLNNLIFVGMGAYLLFEGKITADIFVGAYSAIIMINMRLRFFMNSLETYFDTSGTIDNALEKILSENKIKDADNAKKLEFSKGDIEFKDITFAYSNETIFKDFNLTIKNGEKLALVGKSGAGKSTIVNLLQRFYDISGGTLNLNGLDIRQIEQESLRHNIAYIPQEPGLFSRTVADNIAYGKANATRDDVINAAKLANAHEFIEKLPNGYDEVVGERGFKLSGGQKQRLAIARAILKDAPIVIMDEATSALDSYSEKLIQKSMEKLLEDKTCIIIAHRLSTIKSMDRVVVIEDGDVIEDGTHNSLVRKDGTYKKLWKLQQDGFLTE